MLVGSVDVGPLASICFGAVLRGDVNAITVGPRSNIQDGRVVRCSTGGWGTRRTTARYVELAPAYPKQFRSPTVDLRNST